MERPISPPGSRTTPTPVPPVRTHRRRFQPVGAIVSPLTPTVNACRSHQLDRGTRAFGLRYDSWAKGHDSYRNLSRHVARHGSGQWRTAVFLLNDARCEDRCYGADFALKCYGSAPEGDLHVSAVRVTQAAVTLVPESDCLAADGESECGVRLTARDAKGSSVAGALPLQCQVQNGSLSTRSTMTNGETTLRFRAGDRTGRATVHVRAGELEGEVALDLLPGRGPLVETEQVLQDFVDLKDCLVSALGMGPWSFKESTSPEGHRCARLDYTSIGYRQGTWQLVEMRMPRVLVGKPKAITAWVWNDGAGGNLDDYGVVDAEGEQFQLEGTWENPAKQWFLWEDAVDSAPGASPQEGNGKLDFPLTFAYLKLHPPREKCKGYVLLRDLRAKGVAPASEVVRLDCALDPAPELFHEAGKPVAAKATLTNLAVEGAREVDFTWEGIGPNTERAGVGGQAVKLQPGQTAEVAVEMPTAKPGSYTLSLHAEGGLVDAKHILTVPVADGTPREPKLEVITNASGLVQSVTVDGNVCLKDFGLVLAAPRWANPRLLEQTGIVEGTLTRTDDNDTSRFDGVVTLTDGNKLRIAQTVAASESELTLTYTLTPETDIETEAVLLAGYLPLNETVGCPWYTLTKDKREVRRFPEQQSGRQEIGPPSRPDRLGWFTQTGHGLELPQPATGFGFWQVQDDRRFGLDTFEVQLYASGKCAWKAGQALTFGVTMRTVWWVGVREGWRAE